MARVSQLNFDPISFVIAAVAPPSCCSFLIWNVRSK
ncbi:uncharacterized protein G2W53_033085 [Senna tora]|uniref:Uncharacterized protein n=1 Tax=Senna tora TaxID=362788 RepID=A0A834SXS8_9FABA|nr:uncharacterized protein G2W53_033085 [Senna tora]